MANNAPEISQDRNDIPSRGQSRYLEAAVLQGGSHNWLTAGHFRRCSISEGLTGH